LLDFIRVPPAFYFLIGFVAFSCVDRAKPVCPRTQNGAFDGQNSKDTSLDNKYFASSPSILLQASHLHFFQKHLTGRRDGPSR
jgi:hypothetical protein